MSEYEFWKDLGNIFDAILNYQKKNVEFNNRFINPWIRLGNIFDREDQHKEAVQAYQRAIEIDPDSAHNWVDLGDAHFKAGTYDEAIVSYTRAAELDPKAGWPLSNLGLTLVTLGKCEDAIPLFTASIELFTDDKDKAVSWNRLGNAYRKLSDYQNAFLAFQKADDLDGENTGFKDRLDEAPESNTMVAPEEVLDEMGMDRAESAEAPIVEQALATVALEDAQPEMESSEKPRVQTAPVQLQEEESPAAPPQAKANMDLMPEAAFETAGPEAEVPAAETEIHEASTGDPEPLPDWLKEEEANPREDDESDSEYEETEQEVEPVEESVEQVTEEVVTLSELKIIEDSAVEAVEETLMQEETPATEEAPEASETVPAESVFETSTSTTELAETYTEFTSTPVVDPSTLEDTQPVRAVKKESPEDATVGANAEVPVLDESEDAVQTETAYDEYLKDAVEPVSTLTDHMEGLHTGVPITKVSDSGDVRIAMDTENAHVWNELGNVYLNSGSLDDAVSAYGRAIELDRQFAWPYSNLALAYVQKGRFAESILLYQRSIELFESDKDKAVTWNRLGNVYRRMNDYANAIAAYQTADELDPDNATLSLRSHYGLLGNLYTEKKPNYVL